MKQIVRYALRVLLLVIAFGLYTSLHARPAGILAQDDADTASIRRMGSVSVKAHTLPQTVTSSRPVQSMQREEMEALGLYSLADAVKKFAGTTVRDYGGVGGMKTVSVRNLGAHHTAVSYDGIPVSNTQAGQIDISRFSLDNVQQLSLALGNVDDIMLTARHFASAGVLSIETERPHFDAQRAQDFRFRLRGGSFGLVSPSMRYGQRLGKRTALMLDGSYMRSDGTYPYLLRNATQTTKEKRYNSDIYSWQGEGNLFHTFADSSHLQVKSGYFYSQRGLPGTVIFYANPSEQRLWDEDFYAQAAYDKRFSPQWQLKARLKYSHTWNQYDDPRQQQHDVDRQNEYYASATLGYQPYKAFTLALAEDVAWNDLRNNINMNVQNEFPYPKRFTSLTSLTARFKVPRFDVQANVVQTYSTEDVRVGLQPDDRYRLSPSVSLSYRLLEQQALYVRLLYKNTFRLPTFNDLYYRRMGNPGLSPEKATMYNAGLTWSGQLLPQLFVAATVDGYYHHVHDKIVAFPSTYVWRMANFGKTRIYGMDATLQTEIGVAPRVQAVVLVSMTLQNALDVTNPASQTYKNHLPYTPEQYGSLSFMLNNPWLNVGYSLNYCGHRYSMAQNKPEYRISAYTEHTLTVSRELLLRRTRLNLQGSIVNLTNKQYEVILYYPMPRRSWMLTATAYF